MSTEAASPADPPAAPAELKVGTDGKVGIEHTRCRIRRRVTPEEWAELEAGYPGVYRLL